MMYQQSPAVENNLDRGWVVANHWTGLMEWITGQTFEINLFTFT